MGKKVSNKIVILLALIVVLIIAFSTWLVLNKINSIEENHQITQENVIESLDSSQAGKVSLKILPPEGVEEIENI
ncbi:MAG: hypothetical protein KKA65_01090 [Nanoarchaeota archaeon]|nr:hypothetical protein [Nanoarchaeota archaeon]MBU4456074.1 hypothetical protein [Nanoarchaeota archaeon]MCG2720307.1 hypothetical protein [Nanoarchaeota archaeon]